MDEKGLKRKLDYFTDQEIETKKGTFQCETCQKTFTLKHNLTRHILSHTTFFKCEFCDRKFRRKDVLKQHLRNKHQQTGGRALHTNTVHMSKSDSSPTGLSISTGKDVQSIIPSTSSERPPPLPVINTIPTNNTIPEIVHTSHANHPSVFKEHNYTKLPTSIDDSDKKTSIQDHNYSRPSITSYQQDHTYSVNSALDNIVKDFTMEPNGNEKHDLLAFFANVQSQVKNILSDRIKQYGIKWYLTIQVEFTKNEDETQSSSPHFRSRNYSTLTLEDFDDHDLNESFQKMFESFEKYVRESSGWTLKRVLHLTVHIVMHSPLHGSSFVELPMDLRRVKSLLNIKNIDQKCFLWSCLASIHPLNSPLAEHYEIYQHELNMKGITYPVTINQLNKFEKQNETVSVNVFTYEEKEIIPLRISKQKQRNHVINLLLLQTENNSHYCLIQNLDRFLSWKRKGTRHHFHCHYCLHGFTTNELLENHIPYCELNGEQKIIIPSNEESNLEFRDYEKTMHIPYVIYADFETLNKPFDDHSNSPSTTKTQILEPCSFAYKVVSSDPEYKTDTVIYRGKNASKKLLECLLQESYEISQSLNNIKPLNLTPQEENAFQLATKCCICDKLFIQNEKKARHHDHVTSKFIGASHLNCNLQCKQVKFIPVVFHNLKNFDGHLLCQSIGHFKNKKLSCIPNTLEKYVSFSIGNLRFLDSYSFLPSSLETLAKSLLGTEGNYQPFIHFQNEIKEHRELLLRKGTYPYEYMDSWEKFDENNLPSRTSFYSSLTGNTISEEEYQHAQQVFQTCNCQNIGEYHDIYLKTDVLLLADIFENFRNLSEQNYGLDPCHFFTLPGLSWQAMLKMTGVTLQLMTDIDQILFIERGIRGGISQISNRYAKANNRHLFDYDTSKATNYISYLDVNNLYGYSMSDYLPCGFFTFLTEHEIESFDVMRVSKDSSKGYILEVDLEYPHDLHDEHNDYPLAPEQQTVRDEQLSPYAKKVWKKLHGKSEEDPMPPRSKVKKLLTTLEQKENYVLHYRNLQLYLQLGMKVKKIHRILEFEQEPFMKAYVEFNTLKRRQAKSTFEQTLYKFFNNSIYGKTMECVRKHRRVELCHTKKRLKKLSAKPTYKSHRIFSKDLVGVELTKNKVKMNKPIYIGMTILDLSKCTMYDFYYNHMKRNYGDKVKLLMTDTDSFLFQWETQDLFKEMFAFSHLFDCSNFPADHFLYSNVNKKVMGKMKSETAEKCISEFCGLRSKMYAFSCNGSEDKRAKGIKKCVVDRDVTLQNYKDTLFQETTMKSSMNFLRCYNHQIYCETVKKIGLSCFDDKRFLLEDGISSLAYGHYKIQQMI